MSKAISMYLNPQGGKIVSRTSEDTARMVAHAEMMTGDDRTSGTLVVRCDVSKHGVISLEAGEGNASRRNRELFYAQIAIDRSQQSGIRLIRETVAPARPDDLIATMRHVCGLAKHGATSLEDIAAIEVVKAMLRDR